MVADCPPAVVLADLYTAFQLIHAFQKPNISFNTACYAESKYIHCVNVAHANIPGEQRTPAS